ncbi:class I SAM-dependent methyltransferase [Xylanibacillus composti]|uniref:Methyltransferase n=1 Tax=Xylanibacillus composti TaxID=1572762 RepID=A0A8J4H4Y6_9BACL|nr:class I SAM-dependent methyltransferase [Xylanibacillus composti]MDT9726562.1 class I SAM-dependent methyltransferase [Xylanibacillus composti]GIQ68979.1 methyltransferase [Xylanibacillus composti]
MNYIEMLTKFGIGSAHPGGFAATLQQFQEHPLQAGSRILEVGCGTGRTACYLAEEGHVVTAVDLQQGMVAKAERRAEALGLQVTFRQADACALPFDDEQFDVVIVESVTNFAEARRAVPEYFRVLRSGGVLYDREMMLQQAAAETPRLDEIQQFFGMPQLMRREEWVELLRSLGFARAEIPQYSLFTEEIKAMQLMYEDEHEYIDDDVYANADLWHIALRHDQIIADCIDYLAFGLIKAVK